MTNNILDKIEDQLFDKYSKTDMPIAVVFWTVSIIGWFALLSFIF